MKEMLETALKWQWLVFELSFLLGFILILGSAAGTGDTGDADADLDVDADVDVEADVHHDLDPGLDAVEHGGGFKFWTFLGIGKVPVVLLLSVVSILFGVTGLLMQKFLGTGAFPVNAGVAAVVAFVLGRSFAGLMARFMPKTETYVESSEDQAGKTGRLLVRANEKFGLVLVEDGHGNTHQCKCRTYSGSGEIPKGSEVLLVEHVVTGSECYYYVERYTS